MKTVVELWFLDNPYPWAAQLPESANYWLFVSTRVKSAGLSNAIPIYFKCLYHCFPDDYTRIITGKRTVTTKLSNLNIYSLKGTKGLQALTFLWMFLLNLITKITMDFTIFYSESCLFHGNIKNSTSPQTKC